MYFVEHKVILPVTDDILRQTGGIKGLRERVQNVYGLYLSTDEDEIVIPFFINAIILNLLYKNQTMFCIFSTNLRLNIILKN